MVDLLVHDPNAADVASAQLRFGGRPSVPRDGFTWPHCKSCEGAMQFLGQVPRRNGRGESRLLLLFMCQNDPGCCNEWEADEGGNFVADVAAEALTLAAVPDQGDTLRPTLYGAQIVPVEGDDYDAVRGPWASSNGRGPREVLGQLGGNAGWIQGDQTPKCPHCRQRMALAAQLEQGPDAKTAMNFGGGGCAYVFTCDCAPGCAKFLWQC